MNLNQGFDERMLAVMVALDELAKYASDQVMLDVVEDVNSIALKVTDLAEKLSGRVTPPEELMAQDFSQVPARVLRLVDAYVWNREERLQ